MATPFASRRQISMRAYPKFGAKVSGGFLSHKVGKFVFRIVPELMAPRIHFCDYPTHNNTKNKNIGPFGFGALSNRRMGQILSKIPRTPRIWVLSQGDIRRKTYETERKSLHDLLEDLEQSEGVAGLKRLYRELCAAIPDLVARLDQYDLYRLYDFNFDAKRAKYFPQFLI